MMTWNALAAGGQLIDYATGDVVPGTTLGARLLARPFDRLEVELRRDG